MHVGMHRARPRARDKIQRTKFTMNENQEARYQCVGICMSDRDSGSCLGCGRPPAESPGIVAEAVKPSAETIPRTHHADDPDTPK